MANYIRKPRIWSVEKEALTARMFAEGYSATAISDVIGVSRETITKYLIRMGLRDEFTASAAKEAKPLPTMPPEVRFEDVGAEVLAREPRGRVPSPTFHRSPMGCSAQMCVG